MTQRSEIFDRHYEAYCREIAAVDLAAIKERLDIQVRENTAWIPFFNQTYQVSGEGIFNDGNRKADYVTSVILSKYILLCPDRLHLDKAWCTFRDFKRESHFTNANFFNTDTQGQIIKQFSGRLPELQTACERLGAVEDPLIQGYDLAYAVKSLPRLSLLLLMNDADEDFGADCKVLFQKQAEYYLDPESLAMTSALLARKLIDTDRNHGG